MQVFSKIPGLSFPIRRCVFPYINDYNKDPIELDAESLMYRKTFEIARYLADESNGTAVFKGVAQTGEDMSWILY